MNLGLYFKRARESAGLSQLALAKRLGYETPQFVSNWERGLSKPPISSMRDLCSELRLDPKKIHKMFVDQYGEDVRHCFF